jgi:hypothetical protein
MLFYCNRSHWGVPFGCIWQWGAAGLVFASRALTVTGGPARRQGRKLPRRKSGRARNRERGKKTSPKKTIHRTGLKKQRPIFHTIVDKQIWGWVWFQFTR